MAGISYEYKVGVKREIVSALRKVLGESYPDPELAGKISVVAEYPMKEISYPMVIVRFNPGEIKNIGIGHYEIGQAEDGAFTRVLHWIFNGTLSLTVNALTPMDRDKVMVGLINLFAFGSEIPGFASFRQELGDYDFVAITLMTDSLQETGDQVTNPPWDPDEEVVFTDSLIIPVFGEFFTQPTTGDLIQISHVNLFPYHTNQSPPVGSQATDGLGHDDRTVPWVP